LDDQTVKYADTSQIRSSFLMRMLFSAKKSKLMKLVLFVFLGPIYLISLPFIFLSSRYLFWHGKVQKLFKKKKYEEAFVYGFSKLSKWSEEKNSIKNRSWPPFQTFWCMTFAVVCESAEEINDPDILKKLEGLYDLKPLGDTGCEVAQMLCSLARVSWVKGQKEKALDLINKAIQSDDTYGHSYYLRAWFGEQLGREQVQSDLVMAIRNQPELKEKIFNDELFMQKPDLLAGIKLEVA